jgi:hypothetical protein
MSSKISKSKKSVKAKKLIKASNKTYTNNNDTISKFVAYIKTSPVDEHPENHAICFTIKKSVDDILFDEVEEAVYFQMDKSFPEQYYPSADISDIFIFDSDNDTKKYPVLCEDDKAKIDELQAKMKLKNADFDKFLVLPSAIYTLTAESAVYMLLKDMGYIDEYEEFKIEDMKKIVDKVREYSKSNI